MDYVLAALTGAFMMIIALGLMCVGYDIGYKKKEASQHTQTNDVTFHSNIFECAELRGKIELLKLQRALADLEGERPREPQTTQQGETQ